jgi:hypothetical protein
MDLKPTLVFAVVPFSDLKEEACVSLASWVESIALVNPF